MFIVSNAGVLPGAWPLVLRLLDIATFALVVALVLRADVIGSDAAPTRAQLRGYGFTVLAEVLAILVGSRVFLGVFDLAEATLPWVATVVGVHFIVFARIFKESIFAVLGVPMSTCGLGGVAPGAILLAAVGCSAWVGRRAQPDTLFLQSPIAPRFR